MKIEKLAIHGGIKSIDEAHPHWSWPVTSKEEIAAVAEFMKNGSKNINGYPAIVAEFESEFANYHDTKFALTETRIGLTPSQISPYVINRLGYATARKMMLLGASINGKEAMAIGIADYLASDTDNLEEILGDIKSQVFKCSPNAIAITKQVLTINEYLDPEKAADLFSDCIVSDEGKEGFNSFFEKRNPYWVPDKQKKKQ